MKAWGMIPVMLMALFGVTAYGQAREAEVPGDNFSLEGALELFKKSESPEDFERLLNSPDSKVNNLDLNGDGYIDYIRVFDRQEGNVHAFVLQAVISERESQDIAVIELEKLANGKAVLQIVGDEDIYGVTTIIEPTSEVRTYAGTQSSTTVVNVWAWPSVRYVYAPYYRPYYSAWGWYSYPVWWRPWRPMAYVHYYPIYSVYRPHYSYCHTRRIAYAHHIYHPHRTTSVIVHHRHRDQVVRYRNSPRDGYRNGYARNDRDYRDGDRSSQPRNGGYNSRSNRGNSDRDNNVQDRRNDHGRDDATATRPGREVQRQSTDRRQQVSPEMKRTFSQGAEGRNRTVDRDYTKQQVRTRELQRQSTDRRQQVTPETKRTFSQGMENRQPARTERTVRPQAEQKPARERSTFSAPRQETPRSQPQQRSNMSEGRSRSIERSTPARNSSMDRAPSRSPEGNRGQQRGSDGSGNRPSRGR